MKRAALLLGIVALVSFSVQAADDKDKAAGAKFNWKACEKELKEFSCKGTDQEIWACLEKHDEKLSETCDKEHAKGDDLFEEKK